MPPHTIFFSGRSEINSMTEAKIIIDTLRYGELLKTIDRSGWALSGVKSERTESVAEHSYGSVISSIIIAQYLKSRDTPINIEKVVIMATLHDLPESITGDIAKTEKFLENPENVRAKDFAEKKAIESIINPLGAPFEEFLDIWYEFNQGESLESRVVKGADIIDMLLHARSLEISGISPKKLHQFFKSSKSLIDSIAIEVVSEIYNMLFYEHELEARALNIILE
ncbi:HD family hydrolase [Candidatus Thorarchaeota archaeon]|nr:MAG: HD family hydrolase [Candidatus Thorarchaeota archaeon]